MGIESHHHDDGCVGKTTNMFRRRCYPVSLVMTSERCHTRPCITTPENQSCIYALVKSLQNQLACCFQNGSWFNNLVGPTFHVWRLITSHDDALVVSLGHCSAPQCRVYWRNWTKTNEYVWAQDLLYLLYSNSSAIGVEWIYNRASILLPVVDFCFRYLNLCVQFWIIFFPAILSPSHLSFSYWLYHECYSGELLVPSSWCVTTTLSYSVLVLLVSCVIAV